MTPLRICLVTPSHVASNPRLVKEADALQAAGYDVHVVACRYFPPLDDADATILGAARWQHTSVDLTAGAEARWARVMRRLARLSHRWTRLGSLRWAMQAQHASSRLLVRHAAEFRADLYIGHCLAGLAAAAAAAMSCKRHYAFDAEDFHPAETVGAEADPAEARLVRRIEATLLPGCLHITAASPLIGRAYAETYRLARAPVTLLNVFPRVHAPPAPHAPPIEQGGPARLYWFSQTIGPGRGLEQFVAALAHVARPCTLALRGLPAAGFPDALRHAARRAGFGGTIEFLPLADPAEMAGLAAGYDLGLSLEQSTPRNRDLCLTNKIFTYLLAGVPVALTPTTAQRALAAELGAAGLMLDGADSAAAGAVLNRWIQDVPRQRAARTEAWRLGQERFNWDVEQRTLIATIQESLAMRP